MSVYVTMRVNGDLAAFEAQAAADPDRIKRIMAVAKGNGLIAHRWFGRDGEVMAVDEWPEADDFHRFFEAAGADVGPLMEAIGVTSPPEISVWQGVELGDTYGWGA